MPREGSKAARIMKLYARGYSTREIGQMVGCRPEYVRVVARQRKGNGQSRSDNAYLSRIRKSGNRDAARMDGRIAYDAARQSGASIKRATAMYTIAYDHTLRRTANAS